MGKYILLLSVTIIQTYLMVSQVGAKVVADLPFKSDLEEFQTPAGKQIMRLAKSAEMRNYMKPDVNACNDFYTYACGNWAKINPANTDPKTDIFNVLSKAYSRKVSIILNEDKNSGDPETERKLKYFYESCLQRDSIKKNYREMLFSIMEEFGGMPAVKGSAWDYESFDWLQVLAQILRKYGKRIILGVDINADLANNEINRLYIGQWDKLVSGRAREFYNRLSSVWQIELQTVMGLSASKAASTAHDMAEFALKLASSMIDPLEGLGMEDKTRLRMLDEMTETYGPTLNFTAFVKTWLGYEYRLPVYEYVESYILNLKRLMLETPSSTVANYIMWILIQDFRMDVASSDEKQKQKCVEATRKYFVKYLDHVIYKDLVASNPEIIGEVETIWKQLKQTFEDILNSPSSSWMSESTRDGALEKLSAMTFEINGYVNVDFTKELGPLIMNTAHYFENVINILKLRGTNFHMKIQEPPQLEEHELLSYTPAYAAEFNRVILPVAFLQPRYLWDNVYPKALQYGTVGFVIAHEMAHGFDDTVRKYDAKGNLNNWWDRNASAIFETRRECFRQQYGSYTFAGRQLPKSQAQGENIADNVGIRIAYQAYNEWLANHNQTLEYLPHMDSLTEKQLFFLSAAQIWCSDINRTLQRIISSTDVHSPEEVRVRAMFANFDEFSEAFQCELGSKMNPHRKCIIY